MKACLGWAAIPGLYALATHLGGGRGQDVLAFTVLWAVVTLGTGYVSLLALILPAVSALAVLLSIASIAPTRAADRVRAHLMSADA